MDSGRLQPAIYGGLVIGVLSALPIINLGNCCCCLWVLAGGALATYLRQQNSPHALPASEGALVGLLAGLIGGVVAAILSIPLHMMTAAMQQQMLDWAISRNPDMSVELRDTLERVASGSALRAAGMLIGVVVDAVFGMLGGLLGIAMFKKTAPPPPPGTVEVLPPEG
jgi:hypothetical protein